MSRNNRFIALAFLLIFNTIKIDSLSSAAAAIIDKCPKSENWTVSIFSELRCYKLLAPTRFTSAERACGGASIPNIGTIELAMDLIEIMKRAKMYGIWVDAKLNKGKYKWVTGGDIPEPLVWCDKSSRNETNVVLMCPAPYYNTFSIDSCCFTDRAEHMDFSAICIRHL